MTFNFFSFSFFSFLSFPPPFLIPRRSNKDIKYFFFSFYQFIKLFFVSFLFAVLLDLSNWRSFILLSITFSFIIFQIHVSLSISSYLSVCVYFCIYPCLFTLSTHFSLTISSFPSLPFLSLFLSFSRSLTHSLSLSLSHSLSHSLPLSLNPPPQLGECVPPAWAGVQSLPRTVPRRGGGGVHPAGVGTRTHTRHSGWGGWVIVSEGMSEWMGVREWGNECEWGNEWMWVSECERMCLCRMMIKRKGEE